MKWRVLTRLVEKHTTVFRESHCFATARAHVNGEQTHEAPILASVPSTQGRSGHVAEAQTYFQTEKCFGRRTRQPRWHARSLEPYSGCLRQNRCDCLPERESELDRR